ncbi:integral membrane [Pyrenophora seminiperda CCB06]|uniref:Integral membrane n=1 Tax=Pyrenophora seminiperda CCB06 TaxID=1302712 RepID=A0A3M7M809_9PLEO|nr:integral membrane [Pyrenophora seminiperda CCB06]
MRTRFRTARRLQVYDKTMFDSAALGKTRWARNRTAEAEESAATGAADDSQPPRPPLGPHRTWSTQPVNEGLSAPEPGTNAQDFGARPVIEPPTSLESSIDAGQHVPTPTRKADPSSHVTYNTLKKQRARSSSAPNRATPPPQYPRRPQVGREASIGIRRMPTSPALRQVAQQANASTQGLNTLPVLDENHEMGPVNSSNGSTSTLTNTPDQSRLRKVKSAMQVRNPFWGSKKDQEKSSPTGSAPAPADGPSANYSSGMVDVLDTLDPEVATLTSLTNMQNSLFVPNLPFLNRRPTYNLRRRKSATASLEEINRILQPVLAAQAEEQQQQPSGPRLQRSETENTTTTLMTIDSQLSDSRFAVLPENTDISGWSVADKKEVNDHVRHMLHSRRSRMKRSLKGFGSYVRRPLGFLVTLYAFLITAFGLAWVLFLIGWANVGGKQIYVVHIIDSVLVALFAVVGDGLAPFRAVDTYHMIYIAHYHHYTWSRRKKEMLPDLTDHNDLPAEHAPVAGPRVLDPADPEKQWEFTVLTPKQQEKLEHHQSKFCKSHSFYKPHETETHYAFPLRFLVAIVVLLDCHSLLQISLGACTWGIYYKVRPFAITTVILCCSIACNATAGLLIWLGDKRTRKTDVLERMNRQELTEEAIKEVKKKKEKQGESSGGEETGGDESRERSRRESTDGRG